MYYYQLMTLTKSDLQAIRQVLKSDFDSIDRRLNTLDKGQKKIQKDQKIIINSFDTEYLALRKRLIKIENHLDIAAPEF